MPILILAYGGLVYVAFFLAFLYLIAFIGGDMAAIVGAPKTIDAGASPLEAAPAALTNIALLVLFGLQHTIMARPGFKRAWTRILPKPAERSTYVLLTTVLLIALYVYWEPMPAVVWAVSDPVWWWALTLLFYAGFALVLLATFLIDHFELFGLAQVWRNFKGAPEAAAKFHTPSLYKVVRHPLYLGWVIAFWATPVMTAGHLLFAGVWTIYIFIALGYEERDLIGEFGDAYRDYMAKVPMIIPFGARNGAKAAKPASQVRPAPGSGAAQ